MRGTRHRFIFVKILSAILFLALCNFVATPAFCLFKEEGKKGLPKSSIPGQRLSPQDLHSPKIPFHSREPAGTGKHKEPEFVKGEFIVKLKDTVAVQVDNQISRKTLKLTAGQTGLASFDRLNAKYKVKEFTPVLKELKAKQLKSNKSHTQLYEETKTKFSRRASRALKDAKIPNLLNIYKGELENKDADIFMICQEYSRDPNVEYAVPNFIFHASASQIDDGGGGGGPIIPRRILSNDTYVDPDRNETWSTGAWGQNYEDMWNLKQINVMQAWQWTKGSPDVVVAVSDTGIDYNHPDIAANIWVNPGEDLNHNGVVEAWDFNNADDDGNGYIDDVRGWDFTTWCTYWEDWERDICGRFKYPDNDPMDGAGHGTHVAGTIAASTNNGRGIAGISWHSKLMPLKGLDDWGGGTMDELMGTIIYATDNGADIINMSWGGWEAWPWLGYSDPFEEALNYAYAQGIVLIAAAGNDDWNTDFFLPARYTNVIAVSSTNYLDQRSSFSNYGNKIDLVAPGGRGDYDNWRRQNHPEAIWDSYMSSDFVGAKAIVPQGLVFPILRPDDTTLNITWHTLTGPDRGIADLYLLTLPSDCQSPGLPECMEPHWQIYQSFDNYSPTLQFIQREIILSRPENPGPGEVASLREFYFKISGRKNPLSTGYFMDVDGIDFLDGLALFDEYFLDFDDGFDHFFLSDILSIRASGTDLYRDGAHIVGDEYYRLRGTSMAAPHVSGVAALILSQHPEYNVPQVKSALAQGADDLGDPGKDIYFGYGRINAGRSVTVSDPFPFPYAFIDSPRNHQVVRGTAVDIVGSATADSRYFQDFDIAYSVFHSFNNSNPDWQAIPSSLSGPVENNLLGTWDISTLNDGYYLVKTKVNAHNPNYPTQTLTELDERIIHIGNKIKDGYPISFEQYGFYNSPAVGDLDGDGQKEIVVMDAKSNLYVFHPDGTIISEWGWPKTLSTGFDHYTSPALGDLDNDPNHDLEIVIGNKYAFHHDGAPMAGWPNPEFIDKPNGKGSAVLVDLDGDGTLEVIVAPIEVIMDSLGKLYVLNHDGSIRWSYPVSAVDPYQSIAPAVGDVNNDGIKEIVYLDWNANLYVWDMLGNLLPNFPKNIGSESDSSVVLGDIDSDGVIEIIAVVNTGGIGGDTIPYAWHFDRDLNDFIVLPGWGASLSTIGLTSITSPALADVLLEDGAPGKDGKLELIFASTLWTRTGEEWEGYYSGKVYVIGSNGQIMPGWPQETGYILDHNTNWGYGGIKSSSPIVADIDNDGVQEILVGSLDRMLYAWHADGSIAAGFPMDLGQRILSSPILADLDNDGILNLIVGAGTGDLLDSWGVDKTQLYNIVLGPYRPENIEWGQFHHDPQNTGLYPLPPNQPPVLEPIGDKYATVGQKLAFPIQARDSDNNVLKYSTSNLPSGVLFVSYNKTDINGDWHIDAEDVSIFSTHLGSRSGDANYDIRCDFNNDGYIDARDLSILTMMRGSNGSQLLKDSLYFNQAYFSWTPTAPQVGTYSLAFTVTDPYGASDSEMVIIEVKRKRGGKAQYTP